MRNPVTFNTQRSLNFWISLKRTVLLGILCKDTLLDYKESSTFTFTFASHCMFLSFSVSLCLGQKATCSSFPVLPATTFHDLDSKDRGAPIHTHSHDTESQVLGVNGEEMQELNETQASTPSDAECRAHPVSRSLLRQRCRLNLWLLLAKCEFERCCSSQSCQSSSIHDPENQLKIAFQGKFFKTSR